MTAGEDSGGKFAASQTHESIQLLSGTRAPGKGSRRTQGWGPPAGQPHDWDSGSQGSPVPLFHNVTAK